MNSYLDIPDAPWIRDAERNGMPDAPEPVCPVCGWVPDEFAYYDPKSGDVIGCDRCIRRKWAEDCKEFYPKGGVEE